MEAKELVGRWAIREKGVVVNPSGLIDYSYTHGDSPIFIIKVTDSHIIFQDEIFGDKKFILEKRWLDNNWVDSKKNEEAYKKLAYTAISKERRMEVRELVGRWTIRTDSCLGDWSYTDSPIFIIKVTKRGIVYRDDLFKDKRRLGKEWLDNNWTDYEKLVHTEEPVRPENIVKLLLSKLAALLKRIKLLIRNLWPWLKKKMIIISKKMVPQQL